MPDSHGEQPWIPRSRGPNLTPDAPTVFRDSDLVGLGLQSTAEMGRVSAQGDAVALQGVLPMTHFLGSTGERLVLLFRGASQASARA